MSQTKPTVLIGPCEEDPTESVSLVNRCFVDGLSDRYEFIPHVANRSFGGTRRSSFNLANVYFFLKHSGLWFARVVHRRPQIVHYSINSGWALEKGLALLQVGRWFGARTIGHLHSGSFLEFWAELAPGRKRRAARHLAALDALIVLSEEWKRRVVSVLGLPAAKVHVVNNPLERAFEEEALAMPVEREGKMFLALGVMDVQKGILDLIEAVALARTQAEFTLVVAGPERQPGIRARVEQLIHERKVADIVQVRPGIWGAEKIRLFREASALVLPSYCENFPIVVLEAAAAALPIIASPVGATVEFFGDESSLLFVPPGDSSKLAAAMVRLSTDASLRRRLGTSARACFAQRLARQNIMNALTRIYREVLTGALRDFPTSAREISDLSPKA